MFSSPVALHFPKCQDPIIVDDIQIKKPKKQKLLKITKNDFQRKNKLVFFTKRQGQGEIGP
jgi:hypothetical protein